jgi:hypothetical protein
MAPARESTRERMESARELVNLFRLERYSYLFLSCLTAAFVIYVGWQAYTSPIDNKIPTVVVLFGSGGVVTFNISKLLVMFNKVIDAVFLK